MKGVPKSGPAGSVSTEGRKAGEQDTVIWELKCQVNLARDNFSIPKQLGTKTIRTR